MKTILLAILAAVSLAPAARAQDDTRTGPATAADLEEVYTTAIEKRAADILVYLALTDTVKATNVHDAVIAQYRALRARDEAIDSELKAAAKAGNSNAVDRAALFRTKTQPLHDQFVAKLAKDLTPEQIEKVKDKMTYLKVKVTYEAYNDIVPNLTEQDKTQIMELLKQAREEAIDGGSAKEKSDIFQKYKDRINTYLDANGHDVAKAYRDWNAKQEALKAKSQAKADAAPPPTTPAGK